MHTVHVCQYKHSSFFVQQGNTPLLLAAHEGHAEVVRMLLNEFSSSLDEVNNVSVFAPACSQSMLQLVVSTTYMVKHAFQ